MDERLMAKGKRFIGLILAAWLLCGCEDTTFQSSVPPYPVRVVIDTRVGEFVHFQPEAINTYITVTRDGGYCYNGRMVLPLAATDPCGYGGVVVYINIMGGYDAYDMACPFCAQKRKCRPCEIDGIYARCPDCGEEYDLSSGVGNPMHAIAHESLRRLQVTNQGGKLTIKQRQ